LLAQPTAGRTMASKAQAHVVAEHLLSFRIEKILSDLA
jgi:hypothetical protein